MRREKNNREISYIERKGLILCLSCRMGKLKKERIKIIQ